MADKSEMEVILDEFAIGAAKPLGEILAKFRNACHSDEEFRQRMWIESEPENPHIRQYFFDGKPVFYTIFEIIKRKMQFKIVWGSIYRIVS